MGRHPNSLIKIIPYELVEQIDEAVLSNYFTNIWQIKTKKSTSTVDLLL